MGSIEMRHVSKWFSPGTPVLNDLHFREEGPGAIGYLGPNGAGKTTTLKLLLGLLVPSVGEVLVNGYDPVRDRRHALARVGAIVENPEPYATESVFDALDRVGQLRGLGPAAIDQEIDRCHGELHLPPLDRPCGRLSKGERQRVVLAAACLGDPEVLLLDEPTNGMDPTERAEVRRFLERLKRDHLILMSSHLIGDVAAVCDRLIVLRHGEIRLRASAEEIAARTPVRVVDVEFERPPPTDALDRLRPWALTSTPISPRRLRLEFDGTEESRAELLGAAERLGSITSFGPAVPVLEAAYREIVTDEPTSGGASA